MHIYLNCESSEYYPYMKITTYTIYSCSRKHISFQMLKNVILLPADCFSILLGLANSFHCTNNHISGVMVSDLPSSVVDCGFEPWLGQSKDYKIGICCLFANHTALTRKSKDWLARNQDNVSKWGDISILGLQLLQWATL